METPTLTLTQTLIPAGLARAFFSGPDHLAAVMPACLGQRWWRSSRVGAIWALGHGVSAMFIGFLGFFLKDRLARGAGSAVMMRAVSSWADVAVGASLIIIGAFGIKEARGFESAPADLSAAGNTFDAFGKVQRRNRTIMLNGMLHGFSVDGTPSLAPALALPSAGAVFVFLVAYCLGTILAMGTVTTVIGEGSLRLGSSLEQVTHPRTIVLTRVRTPSHLHRSSLALQPDFPKKLSLGSCRSKGMQQLESTRMRSGDQKNVPKNSN